MKKLIIIVIVGLTMASIQLKAQCYDRGVILHCGWAMDWNNVTHGFNPSRVNVAAYYCGIGFVGSDVYFSSKDDDSFRIDLKGGLDVHILHFALISPYFMVSYTHYKTDFGLPEVSIGYGGMLNLSIFAPVGVYVDVHKAHFLGEDYVPQKAGPLVLSLGFMVAIRGGFLECQL